MTPTPPSRSGQRVRIDPIQPADQDELLDLDWHRSLHPAMAGWAARAGFSGTGTAVLRDVRGGTTGAIVGAIDAVALPGYPGVMSVSIFVDGERARGGAALEGYALYVDALFEQGVRVVHHEVLELNDPIRRAMRALRLEASARLREHAYVGGRWWDVLVYSYDEAHWRSVLDRLPRNPVSGAEQP